MDSGELSEDDLFAIAPKGYYIALRIGYAFPKEEVNALPRDWIKYYTAKRLVLCDPIIQWGYTNSSITRWSDPSLCDPHGVLSQAASFGLRYGAGVACRDAGEGGERSFAQFVRDDREFTDEEMILLSGHLEALHFASAAPTNLTGAELEALAFVKNGMRLKQVAFELGITEGAVKLRLRKAKAKLGAATSTQAAAIALDYGLI